MLLLWLALKVSIPAGEHRPFYASSPELETVQLEAFQLDASPVTNAEFLAFVQKHPRWDQGGVDPLFAEPGYLAEWAAPSTLGELEPLAPVVSVSWHAARAYCRAEGGDLPTTWQWEYAADATETTPSGAGQDPKVLEVILAWYATGGSALPGPVRQSTPNHFGLYDMHGLIWEWTLDFDAQPVSADAREAGDEERLRFCGAGAATAADAEDYAAFMRLAFRDSLSARYVTSNLGFRCAYPS